MRGESIRSFTSRTAKNMGNLRGICRLCGEYKVLSEEHIPPKMAFNSDPILVETFENFVKGYKPTKFRQGMNVKSLCERCNNTTGDWFARALIEWCKQGFQWVGKTNGILYLPYYIQPLNVIKQILVMAVTRVDLRITNYVLAEVSLPPFGYCICPRPKDGKSIARQQQLCDITWFATYDYNIWTQLELRLPVRETHEPFPLDYRTKAEVDEHYIRNSLPFKNKRK